MNSRYTLDQSANRAVPFDTVLPVTRMRGSFAGNKLAETKPQESMRTADDPDGLEEERRLMYVALTRARKTLMLSSARDRMVNGSMETMRPSRFLREIPEDLLENYAPSWRRYDLDDDGSHSTGWSVTPDPEALAGLQKGVRVRHDLYGSGVVRRLAGRGMNARAVVRFDDGVEREFVLEYAGLQLLEDMEF